MFSFDYELQESVKKSCEVSIEFKLANHRQLTLLNSTSFETSLFQLNNLQVTYEEIEYYFLIVHFYFSNFG